MERREDPRNRRRIPCEFQHQGDHYRGIAVNISRSGLFIQTDATLEPGAELEVELLGDQFEGASFRAEVARRRATPALLAAVIRPGLGVRIVEAPDSFFEMLGEGYIGAEETPAEGEPGLGRRLTPLARLPAGIYRWFVIGRCEKTRLSHLP